MQRSEGTFPGLPLVIVSDLALRLAPTPHQIAAPSPPPLSAPMIESHRCSPTVLARMLRPRATCRSRLISL